MRIDRHVFAERVNLRIYLLSLLVGILGIVLMATSPVIAAAKYHKTATLLEESGAALFISGVLAAMWELAGKRAFADEILAKANMSRDLAEAGIDLVAASFKDERIDWDQLFKNSCRLDIFVSYAHTWRNTHSERIDKLLSDPDGKLRVILPDTESKEVLSALSARFEMDQSVLRQEIDEATKFFARRKRKAKGSIELHMTCIMPLFSSYRFNSKAVFALYNHKQGQLPVPAFVCDKDGFLVKFFTDEFEGILGDTKRTRAIDLQQVEPERTGATKA